MDRGSQIANLPVNFGGVIGALLRAHWGWLLVFITMSAGLCFAPLFNLLGYEFSFAMTIPATFCGAQLGWRAFDTQGPRWRAWAVAGAKTTAICAVALVPISLNALRVRNCDYLEGLLFFGALPVVSGWVSAGFGVATGALTKRRKLLFGLLFFGWLLVGLARFWFQPPVDAFSPFLGYFPGSIYDEVILIDDRFLFSRIEDLVFAGSAIALSFAWHARCWCLGCKVSLAVAASITAGVAAKAHDVHRDAEWIQEQLGARYETDSIVVHYPKAWSAKKIDRLAADLAFNYQELAAFFGTTPKAQVHVYYYASTAQKKRLMGAGRSRIAKPWQRTLHIQTPHVGAAVVRHELAHVFSAEIANSPHHLSLRGGLPNMGLIEGLAVAATWENGRLSPTQWTAAMKRAGKLPDPSGLLRPDRFLATNSRTAYTVCGSLIRFQWGQGGMPTVERTYRDGSIEVDTLERLLQDWHQALDRLPLDARAVRHAKDRFDRPAIFTKICAHEIAALRREASAVSRDPAAWLVALDRILKFVPRDGRSRLARISALTRLGKHAAAREEALVIADDPKAGALNRARAGRLAADADAREGRLEAATTEWERQLALTFSRPVLRSLSAKLAAARLTDPEQRRLVLDHLLSVDRLSRAARLKRAEALATLDPAWAVGHYLRGRLLLSVGQVPAARVELEAALRLGLPHPALIFEAERQLAERSFRAADYPDAARRYAALADRSELDILDGERDTLRRWARRARFFLRWAPKANEG